MPGLEELLDELERVLAEMERLDEPLRTRVFSLLDGVDALHRHALARLAASVAPEELERARAGDPAVAWLLDAYAVGVDERAAAETALDAIRPYIHSHGGDVSVLAAAGGIVRVKLSGACSGCTASTITLRRGVEEALREGFPGFVEMEVEEDAAPAHPPPSLLTIESFVPPPGGGAGAG